MCVCMNANSRKVQGHAFNILLMHGTLFDSRCLCIAILVGNDLMVCLSILSLVCRLQESNK